MPDAQQQAILPSSYLTPQVHTLTSAPTYGYGSGTAWNQFVPGVTWSANTSNAIYANISSLVEN